MIIKCNNVDDFCTMITSCISNSIKDVRIFISFKESYPPIINPSSKSNISFTFACLTPLYTAMYSTSIKNSEFDLVYNKLQECQEQCNHDFRIQVFDELYLNKESTYLTIGREIDVI